MGTTGSAGLSGAAVTAAGGADDELDWRAFTPLLFSVFALPLVAGAGAGAGANAGKDSASSEGGALFAAVAGCGGTVLATARTGAAGAAGWIATGCFLTGTGDVLSSAGEGWPPLPTAPDTVFPAAAVVAATGAGAVAATDGEMGVLVVAADPVGAAASDDALPALTGAEEGRLGLRFASVCGNEP
jgi:hypothetical protein